MKGMKKHSTFNIQHSMTQHLDLVAPGLSQPQCSINIETSGMDIPHPCSSVSIRG